MGPGARPTTLILFAAHSIAMCFVSASETVSQRRNLPSPFTNLHTHFWTNWNIDSSIAASAARAWVSKTLPPYYSVVMLSIILVVLPMAALAAPAWAWRTCPLYGRVAVMFTITPPLFWKQKCEITVILPPETFPNVSPSNESCSHNRTKQ